MNALTMFFYMSPERNRGVPEELAASAYTKTAITDFDGVVRFHPDYKPFEETPDVRFPMGRRLGERELEMQVFLEQPVVQIHGVDCSLTSSSYLIGPQCNFDDLMLPFIDVVELGSECEAMGWASDVVADLYRRAGFQVIKRFGEQHKGMDVCVNPRRWGNDVRKDIMHPQYIFGVVAGQTKLSFEWPYE